ncbi:hypothetical protein [Nitratireductor rhodophyticola]
MNASESEQVRLVLSMENDLSKFIDGAPTPVVIGALGVLTCRVFSQCAKPCDVFIQFSATVLNNLAGSAEGRAQQ